MVTDGVTQAGAKWSESRGGVFVQGRRTQAMDETGREPCLSAEEIALFEEMTNDLFIRATVSAQDMRAAIAEYAYRNWQA